MHAGDAGVGVYDGVGVVDVYGDGVDVDGVDMNAICDIGGDDAVGCADMIACGVAACCHWLQ